VIANNLKWEVPSDIPSLGDAACMAVELIQHRAARNADTWPMCKSDEDRMERAAVAIEELTARCERLAARLRQVAWCETCEGIGAVPAMIEAATGAEPCPYIYDPCPACTAK
jgi:hypothetical protein